MTNGPIHRVETFKEWLTTPKLNETKMIAIKPENAEKEFLLLTCKWRNGQFYNDNYVIGVIADTEDLFTLIDDQFR